MGIEIFTFGPLEPEKMRFKDGNPTFRNMTRTAFFSSGFLSRIEQQVKFACNGGDERAIVGLSIGVVRQGREEGREEGPHEAPGAGRQQRCQHQDQEQGHGHDH